MKRRNFFASLFALPAVVKIMSQEVVPEKPDFFFDT